MLGFKSMILPEEPVPPEAAGCERCELSRHGSRMVWGEGNPEAPLLILLDNPGARETKEGAPFLCGTRDTLQIGLHQAGLDVDSVYITYLLKRRPKRAYDKPAAREACQTHLMHQLAEKQPKMLFGLGNVVVQHLFPDREGADVKSFRGKWHEYLGIPAAFSYHPLAVRRRPVLMKLFVEDLKFIAERLASLL